MNATEKQKAEAAALRSTIADRHADAAEAGAIGGNFIRHADGSMTPDLEHPVTKPYERDFKKEAEARATFDAEIAAAHAEAAARATPKKSAPAPAVVAATEADLQHVKNGKR